MQWGQIAKLHKFYLGEGPVHHTERDPCLHSSMRYTIIFIYIWLCDALLDAAGKTITRTNGPALKIESNQHSESFKLAPLENPLPFFAVGIISSETDHKDLSKIRHGTY